MPRYKPVERNGLFIPVVLEEQIQPGTFEFALMHLVDEQLDLSSLDAKFCNELTGASAYDPRAMLKIVLLAYSRGLITSRKIAQACEHNVLFMAISGDARPSYTPTCLPMPANSAAAPMPSWPTAPSAWTKQRPRSSPPTKRKTNTAHHCPRNARPGWTSSSAKHKPPATLWPQHRSA
jgi:hypothetical protein